MVEKSIYDKMSKPEECVSEFLKEQGLFWHFEQPVFVIDPKKRPRVWTPDFYLPELGIYIEVCGIERDDYSFREEVYAKNKIPIIFVHFYKQDKWRSYLISEINKIHTQRWKLIKNLE